MFDKWARGVRELLNRLYELVSEIWFHKHERYSTSAAEHLRLYP